ncbi:MAG: 2-oxo acid dehydrogenase subunit E2, partial [Clostridia bacterium]|nr:2-oxo acid dehydrogenase subunit E2 [Clostridia bacterium]
MKFEFQFPDVGEGIHEGVITKWLVKEGDEVKEGQSIVEVETDKVTTEIPSPRSGKIHELLAKKGDTINVGNVFVTINTGDAGEVKKDEDTDSDGVNKSTDSEVLEEETAGVVGEVIASSTVIPPSDEMNDKSKPEESTRKVLATPVARKLAKDLELDLKNVKGTGPNGRIMKDDIYGASKSSTVEKETQINVEKDSHIILDEVNNVERIKLTKIRKTISQKMSESRFTIPHTTAMDEVDVSKLYELRSKYKEILKDEDINLTYLPFIIKATIAALKKFPEFNASLDQQNDELVLKKYYNIGIAADTDRGLMVPVIK